MSELELRKFHGLLEDLIEQAGSERNFLVDDVINVVITKHQTQMESIQDIVNNLGLRALIRNNCRAKRKIAESGPDLFGRYNLGKRISVPYLDGNGKKRWDKKRREELSFDDLDKLLERGTHQAVSVSKEHRDLSEIAKRTAPYRSTASNIGAALEMAKRDGG